MIHRRPLGDSGVVVSKLGLGTVKFGRNTGLKYANDFALPDEKCLADLLAVTRDAGINLLDTAAAYGDSEQRLGRLLKGQRANWILSSKAGEYYDTRTQQSQFDFSGKAIRQSMQNSLKRLQTDYLDILLIHSNGKNETHLCQSEVIATLQALKKEGYVRAIGISTKTPSGSKLALTSCDCVMVTFNLSEQQEVETLHLAHQLGKGVLIKKPLASGRYVPPKPESLNNAELLMHHHAISSLVFSTINPEHLQETIALFNQATSQV